jgi:hypothetical protein
MASEKEARAAVAAAEIDAVFDGRRNNLKLGTHDTPARLARLTVHRPTSRQYYNKTAVRRLVFTIR